MRTGRALEASPLVGLLVWASHVWLGPRSFFDFSALFLFLPLVLAPLALRAISWPDRRGRVPALLHGAALLQLPAALALTASFLVTPGVAAAALAAPWLVVTLLLATHAAGRVLARASGPVEERLVDAALAYSLLGGAWLMASRLGIEPMGFAEPLVLLTAVHFHAAAFLLPAAIGALGRALLPSRAEPLYRLGALALVIGPALLAIGIAALPPLEVVAAATLGAGAVVSLALCAAMARERETKALLGIAALASVLSMAYAVRFASQGVPLDVMARFHGALNAYVLLPAALLAALQLRAPGRAPRAGMPVSRLASRKRTGPDWFAREGHVEARPRAPTGLVDELSTYSRAGFDAARVHPDILAFYERTGEHALLVEPRWRRGSRWAGRLYRRYARRAGQMVLPLDAVAGGARIESRILALRDDGRPNVRAWVRTYAENGEPVYVAAYATHEERGRMYMNIAFPFPGWNLTSVLRLEPTGRGGVLLTTRATPSTWGDQGVYAVVRGRPLRLPMDETIHVWARGDPAAPFAPSAEGIRVLARHEITLFGVRFLTLDYHIRARSTDDARAPSESHQAEGLRPPPGWRSRDRFSTQGAVPGAPEAKEP